MKTTYKHKTSYGVETRSSERKYTHVIVGKQPACCDDFNNLDVVLGWSGSEITAGATSRTIEKRGFRDVRVEQINNGS